MRRPLGFDEPDLQPEKGEDESVSLNTKSRRPIRRQKKEDAGLHLHSGEREEGGLALGPHGHSAAVGDTDAGASSLNSEDDTIPFPRKLTDSKDSEPESATKLRELRRTAKRATAERRLHERLERHDRNRFLLPRRRKIRLRFAIAGSVVLLFCALALAAYSPLMALREVRVLGATTIPEAQLEGAFTGLLGRPLPLISSSDVSKALTPFVVIESYSTELLPPNVLIVRVIERTAVGAIREGDGTYSIVDAAGVVLSRPAVLPAGLPLLKLEGGTASPVFTPVAQVIRTLPAEVRRQLVEVTAATRDDVRLTLGQDVSVLWGSDEHSNEKASVLAALLKAAPPGTVREYDVSSPSVPVTR